MGKLLFVAAVLLSLPAVAAPSDFNGRWNLKVQNEPRGRVWWLEVEGAGTPSMRGTFVGAPGGQVDKIPVMRMDGEELVFEFQRNYNIANKKAGPTKGLYRARISNGKIYGLLTVDGSLSLGRQFSGERAPIIADKDDATWKKGASVELFNGKDLSGWKAMVAGKDLGWQVKDGLMGNVAAANNLISDQTFWNFELHIEYKLGKGSNSGVGLRGRYEVQIYDDFGKPADTHGNGALYSRKAPTVNASKAPGEWQTFDIRLVGRVVTIALNGKKVVDKFEIPGPTAIANNADEALPGPITIQGDHGAVEFRKITLTPLTKK